MRFARRHPAFTLVEVIVSLVILAIVSIAVCTLTFGAMNSDRYLRSSTAALAELELATRRIATNIRQGQSVSAGTTALTVLTQADATNGYPSGATVVYSLQTDSQNTAQKDLVENDPRLGGTNIIANNVTTFNIVPVSGTADLYQLDIVLGTVPPTERHLKIFGRN